MEQLIIYISPFLNSTALLVPSHFILFFPHIPPHPHPPFPPDLFVVVDPFMFLGRPWILHRPFVYRSRGFFPFTPGLLSASCRLQIRPQYIAIFPRSRPFFFLPSLSFPLPHCTPSHLVKGVLHYPKHTKHKYLHTLIFISFVNQPPSLLLRPTECLLRGFVSSVFFLDLLEIKPKHDFPPYDFPRSLFLFFLKMRSLDVI